MNRLIIIGNGFDLAHGRKTSYNDFLLAFLKGKIDDVASGKYVNDEYLHVIKNSDIKNSNFFTNLTQIRKCVRKTNVWPAQSILDSIDEPVKIEIKNKFLKLLFDNCVDRNWVNVENEYYRQLISIISHPSISEKEALAIELNNSMNYVKREISYKSASMQSNF